MSKTSISPRSVSLPAYTRYEGSNLIVTLTSAGETDFMRGAALELQICHRQEGRVVLRQDIEDLEEAIGQDFVFDMSQVPWGCGALEAVLTDRHGRTCRVQLIQDTLPGRRPQWLGSRKGITHDVPAPWTPLQTKRLAPNSYAVDCACRQYQFDSTSFLREVSAAGRPLLTGPIRLFGTVDGRALKLTDGSLRCLHKADDEVVLDQRINSPSLQFLIQTQVEFDGMVRFDWMVESHQRARVDSLGLEIPLHAEHAEYLYHFPGSWGSASNVGALPEGDTRLGFRPYIWLGDNQRGLAWFSESDRNWLNPGDGCVTEIVRRGRRVLLRLHFISTPVLLRPTCDRPAGWETTPELEAALSRQASVQEGPIEVFSPISYTFGLQATPVKQVERDAWNHRIICIGQGTPGFKPRLEVETWLLDSYVEAGIRTVVLFEYWSDAEGHAVPVDRKRLRKIVKDCHDRGLKILLYFSFLISDLAPEWRDFGKDSLVLPKRGYPLFHYAPQSDQSAWVVCLRNAWQDFLVDGIARMVEEFGIDGVYLDGTEYPWGCCNTLHGCGVVRPDGTISQTFPIFAVRSAMRRLYHTVRAHDPEAQVNVHNSTCMVMATLGWATSYWDGEQFQNVTDPETGRSLLPLDAFRTEFMGHQWGVPAEFLCYGNPFRYEQAWALTLLHDVPVRPGTQEDLELISSLWRVMDTFGRKESRWLPYWRNQDYAEVDPDGAYASLYHHPTNGALAVVSNVSGETKSVNVRLDLKRLGLRNQVSGRDALTDEALPMEDGRLILSLESLGWKVVWISPS